MSASLRVSWRDGVKATAGDGTFVVQGPAARVTFRQVPVAIQALLHDCRGILQQLPELTGSVFRPFLPSDGVGVHA